MRQQRTRAAALNNLLCHQPEGAPLTLSHELVLLHALALGHLDHLADAASAEDIAAVVYPLLAHADDNIAPLLRQIDTTGELDEEGERRLLACVAEVLPPATGRAFFTNYRG